MYSCGSRQDWKALGLYFFYLLGFFTILAEGDVCSCQQYGCSPCPSSGACTKTNVALIRSASSSTLYSSTAYHEVSGSACLGVNGDTGTIFRPINKYPDNPSCVQTDPSDYFPYWEVDLGQQYIISTITVYGRQEAWSNTLKNAIVTVDDEPCYTFAPDYFRPTITQITCRSSLTGRKVRISKVNDTDKPYFAVCQVQVWVCKSGYYDPNCTNTCGSCNGGTCDPSSGECPQGCSAGYQPPYCKDACKAGSYGVNCSNNCGYCSEGTMCSAVTGECPRGCKTGFQEPYCGVVCTPGSYGLNCSSTCGNCSDGPTCSSMTGECPRGCKPGYQGTHCKESCRAGSYGEGCNETCGNCAGNSPCSVSDGRCEAGCEAGFQPPTCKASSQSNDTDRDRVSCAVPVAGAVAGSCAVCTLGFVLAILLMRYRHRHKQDKRPSAACFSTQLKTDFENTTMSTNIYDSLTASRDSTSTYTTLAVKRTGDVSSSPYVD